VLHLNIIEDQDIDDKQGHEYDPAAQIPHKDQQGCENHVQVKKGSLRSVIDKKQCSKDDKKKNCEDPPSRVKKIPEPGHIKNAPADQGNCKGSNCNVQGRANSQVYYYGNNPNNSGKKAHLVKQPVLNGKVIVRSGMQ
jgi:hypothetical protein